MIAISTFPSTSEGDSVLSVQHKTEAVGGAPVFALVPARGGSKALLRKNLALLRGRTLLEYAIRCGLDSRWVDHTFVSSDDDEILQVAGKLGATCLRRPAVLATDTASAIDVVEHFIDSLSAEVRGKDPFIVYLQPTSPLRVAADVDAVFTQMAKHGATTALSVVPMNKSPFKAFQVDKDGRLKSLFDETLSNTRRQDLPPAFLPNGAIYIFRVTDFLSRQGFPSNGSLPYIMDEAKSIDIDKLEDLIQAEKIMGALHA